MIRLIKSVTGEVLDNFETEVVLIRTIEGQFGGGDYINMGGFEAFLQDIGLTYDNCQNKDSQTIINIDTPVNFGLKNNTNFTTLEISY